jgi:4-hydroxybenzoate polyprenyltransferase
MTFHRAPMMMGAAGWLALAGESANVWSLVAVVATVAIGMGALLVVNDLLDEEQDRVTAPYLPLPMGLVTRRAAIWGAVALFLLSFVSLAAAVGSVAAFLLGLAVIAGTTLFGFAYSAVKGLGVLGPLCAGVPYIAPVLIGGIAAAKGWPADRRILPVIVYALLVGIANNTLSALKDVEGDARAGTATLAVRIGADRAFLGACALSTIATAVLLWSIWHARALVAAALWAASVVGMTRYFGPLLNSLRARGRDRIQRVVDLQSWRSAEYLRDIAQLCVYAPLVGLAVGAALELVMQLGRLGYERRLVHGGLARVAQARDFS